MLVALVYVLLESYLGEKLTLKGDRSGFFFLSVLC